MDEQHKVTNHYHIGAIGLPGFLILLLIGAGLIILAIEAKDGDRAAIAILAVLASVALILLGVAIALFVSAQVHQHAERRASIEQERFRDNTKENLAFMESQARAQLAQARAQGEQWKVMRHEMDARYRLPAPEDNGGGFVFDEALFSELDED